MRQADAKEKGLQLWGGFECTVNRVGDRHLDQFAKSGHLERPQDLDLVAELGIRTLRYPVLWERTAPDDPRTRDWSFSDERLDRLRRLDVEPIVGLTHHGSGPKYTSLLDDGFAPGLAEHARAVAERYPWIESYTPVNEPLTTARFSGMYGHWYPHATDAKSFARALLNQVRAVVLSMEAIRKVNPDARLVQTEDLGKTHATGRMAYQAEYENLRRWITWDLLCGKVARDHPMWRELLQDGVEESALGWFLDHPCPPDVVGINHYLTSERFLDHRTERYPAHNHGANAFDRYADVEAVRVLAGGIDGASVLVREAWERYGLPIAITECHLGCTREEQARWLFHVWRQAEEAKAAGADVRAVTVWSLFGAYDWSSLLTLDESRYEPGVYDLRAPKPRPTALAEAVRLLARGEGDRHPTFEDDGWWERPIRLLYEPRVVAGGASPPRTKEASRPRAPLLIVGGETRIGIALERLCGLRGLERRVVLPAEAVSAVARERPWAIVDTVGLPDLAGLGIRYMGFSEASAFDGTKGGAYVESDPAPENSAFERHPEALVVRSGALFGPWWPHDDFVHRAVDCLREGRVFEALSDATISPVFVPDLVHAALDFLLDGTTGLLHVAHDEALTPFDLARRVAQLAELDVELIRPILSGGAATDHSLSSERAWTMPPLEEALAWYSHDLRRRDERADSVRYLG